MMAQTLKIQTGLLSRALGCQRKLSRTNAKSWGAWEGPTLGGFPPSVSRIYKENRLVHCTLCSELHAQGLWVVSLCAPRRQGGSICELQQRGM